MRKKTLFILAGILLLAIVLFSACSPGSQVLDGTSWKLTSYLDDQGQTVDVLPGSVVTAYFQATVVSGISGCNDYNGPYTIDKGKLTFGPMATTRTMCAEPLGIMQQEQAYLSALDKVVSYKVKGETLEMFDDRGKSILIFRGSI
jgi:heat shock protein HslJ